MMNIPAGEPVDISGLEQLSVTLGSASDPRPHQEPSEPLRWTHSRLLRKGLNENTGLSRGRTLANHTWGRECSGTPAFSTRCPQGPPTQSTGAQSPPHAEYPLLQNGGAAASPLPHASVILTSSSSFHPHQASPFPRLPVQLTPRSPPFLELSPCPHHCQPPDHHSSGCPRDSQLLTPSPAVLFRLSLPRPPSACPRPVPDQLCSDISEQTKPLKRVWGDVLASCCPG